MGLGALYRDIVETSLDGIWVFDDAGRTLYANRAIADLLGLEESELATLSVFDPLDAVGRRQMYEHLAQLAQGLVNTSEVECLWHRSDGTRLWVLVRESVLFDEAGAVRGYLHNVSDYSDRRRLFEEVRSGREALAEAQRIAKVGSWEWDLRTGSITGSDELHALYRLTPEQFAGTFEGFLDSVHADDRALVTHAISSALEGKDRFEFDARIKRGDGTFMWARARGEVFRDFDGVAVWSRGTHQDITEAKQSELMLQDLAGMNGLMQAVATTANAAETLHDALAKTASLLLSHVDWFRGQAFVPDPERPGDVTALALDPGQRPNPGRPRAEAAESEPVARERAIALQVLAEAAQVWDEDGDPQQPAIGFPVAVGADLVAVVVVTASSPIRRPSLMRSMVDHVAAQLGRVAERERAAAELAAARDAAMEASRQKSDFLAAMSHEIRTPLNGVIGLNDLLLRTDLDPQQQRLANGARVASRALLAVINDVLDFSKIEAGKLEVEQVDFEVREVFDQVASVLGEAARSKGVELLISCHPEVPERLKGDPTRLAQVLTNLGSNAVKFTDQGQVSIRAVAEQQPDGTLLRVEVDDDGIGIEPEKLDHIFAPFEQADSSTTREFGGTGLGLAIAREIVTALGGEIGVESAPGQGARFWFTARFGPAEGGTAGDQPTTECAVLAGRSVLVVDANDHSRLILAEHLQRWGMTAVAVADVASAQEALRSRGAAGGFEAVLLDRTPDAGSGLDSVGALRQDPNLAGVPLIVLTTLSGPELDDLRGGGGVELLTKPVLGGDLRQALLGHLAGAAEGPGQPEEGAGAAAQPGRRAGVSAAAGGQAQPRLLVVEDNPINQLVALGILETLGYAADTADDGEQAVAAWRSGTYAAILMDVQMPRMDGYAATRAIRSEEPPGRRIPVLAMTAAAVRGEREKCLDAGMDDFLTKPVDPEGLRSMLQRWVHGPRPGGPVDAEAGRAAAEARAPRGVLDLERLDMLRDLDPESTAYLDRAIANFTSRVPESVGALHRAVARADAEALTQAAHRLKGSALNLGMPTVGHLAYELEMLGDAGRDDGAGDLLSSLEEALGQAVARLREYQGSYRQPAAR